MLPPTHADNNKNINHKNNINININININLNININININTNTNTNTKKFRRHDTTNVLLLPPPLLKQIKKLKLKLQQINNVIDAVSIEELR
jgi:hypothetical protein